MAREGEIILDGRYGMANKEKGILNATNTIYDIGSVTKQFTATAILKLVELNKLKVTDPLHRFFKNLPFDKKDITIHQLLTHSAGLIDVIGGDFDHISTEDYFKELFATELIYEPGTKHRYSNSHYSILARIIELVSGDNYESFLYKHLFKPSGMMQTGYLRPEWDSKLYAIGYRENVINVGSSVYRYRKDAKISWNLKGNGGIHSTIGDMYKWYIALKTNKVLSKELTEVLTTPYILEYEDDASYHAYGWAIYKTKRNTKRVTHNGSNRIIYHEFIWLPEEDIVIIYFTSAFTRNIGNIAWDIEKMLFDETYEPKKIVVALTTELLKFALDFNEDIAELSLVMKEKFGNKIKHPFYLNRLGYYFFKEGNMAKAIEVFKTNVKLFSNDVNTWDSLGEAYYKSGNKRMALEVYEKALELDVNYENASYAKKIIELCKNE